MKLDTKEFEEKMQKTIRVLEDDFASVRVGRASARILDKVKVNYYGTPTELSSVANIKTLDARTLAITPWESNLIKDIEKAINAADIGINPQNDGKTIRLCFPPLTEERRKELTKQCAKMGEEAKVALRNIRQIANKKIKDITPIGELKHLQYLEIFSTDTVDISPLANCTELIDLNLSAMKSVTDLSPLDGLTKLERFWGTRMDGLSEEEKERFTAAHPGVQISFNAKHQTSDGWREHERYTHYCWCLKHQTWIPFGEPLPEK